MSLWQIASRNVGQSRGRYLAYLASSAFSVMIYFLYTALVSHPQLQGGFRGAEYVVQGMQAAAVVIAIFTFLFMLYSNSAFVRSRMKEFGLLSLLGVSKGQLIWLILCESFLIAGIALVAGLGMGLLFVKLFFMAISALLRLSVPLPFYAGPRVWIQTIVVFGSIFIFVSLASLRSVLHRNIIQLVRAGRQPKAAPTFSRWKAALGLLLVGGGYGWASVPQQGLIVLGIIPVTIMVSVGTYVLLREGSIVLLTWLHRRERYFYHPGPFLSISQLVYKMQDNYRVLSAVALLVAVILTAVGTAFTAYFWASSETTHIAPHAVQLAQTGSSGFSASAAKVDEVLRQHGVSAVRTDLVTRTAILGQKQEVTLVPYSFYAAVQRRDGQTLTALKANEVIEIGATFLPERYRYRAVPYDGQLQVNGQTLPVRILPDRSGRILNMGSPWLITLVVSDTSFADWMAQTPVDQRLQITVWDSADWQSGAGQAAAAELRGLFPVGEMTSFSPPLTTTLEAQHPLVSAVRPPELSMTIEQYQTAITPVGILLFIGIFVSLVFFAACCSLLYFRLFTESDEDRRYFRRLQQLGVSNPELRRLALGQAMVIFLVPFLAGLLHSTFAMQALGTIIGQTVLQVGWGVALGYLALYTLCFVILFGFYWRSLTTGLVGREMAA